MNYTLPCPHRRRQLPRQFSWIDQRLVRHHYLQRAPSDAWTLYLFLLTVADVQGVSYYSDTRLCQHLAWESHRLTPARQALLCLQLIVYQAPLYQLLALADHPSVNRSQSDHRRSASIEKNRHHLQQLHQALRGQL